MARKGFLNGLEFIACEGCEKQLGIWNYGVTCPKIAWREYFHAKDAKSAKNGKELPE